MRQVLTAMFLAGIVAAGFAVMGGCDRHHGEAAKTDNNSKSTSQSANKTPAPAEQSKAEGGQFAFSAEKDKHEIMFWCNKLKQPVNHEGGFKSFTGLASMKGDDVNTLKLDVDIDVNSIWTDTPRLTEHLKAPDFFEVKKHPKAKFITTKVEKKDAEASITGKLTMHGETKEVTFPAKVEGKTEDGSLSISTGKFKINRHDWNIDYQKGKGVVNEEVNLEIWINKKKPG